MAKDNIDKKKDARRVVFPGTLAFLVFIIISVYSGFVWTEGGDIFLAFAAMVAIVVLICIIWPQTWWANQGADFVENILRNGFKNLMGDDDDKSDNDTTTPSVKNKVGDIRADGGSKVLNAQGIGDGTEIIMGDKYEIHSPQSQQPAPTTPAETVKDEQESDQDIIKKAQSKLDKLKDRLRGCTPIEMPVSHRVILQILPYQEQSLNLTYIHKNRDEFIDIRERFPKIKPDVGVVCFHSEYYHRFVQIYRSGCMEYVEQTGYFDDDKKIIYGSYEIDLVKQLSYYLSALKKLDAKPPFIVILSIIELNKKYGLLHRPYITASSKSSIVFHSQDEIYPINKDEVLTNPIVIRDFDTKNLDTIMKPAFDEIWMAAHQFESKNYTGNKFT